MLFTSTLLEVIEFEVALFTVLVEVLCTLEELLVILFEEEELELELSIFVFSIFEFVVLLVISVFKFVF